jgi:hypothetical protein
MCLRIESQRRPFFFEKKKKEMEKSKYSKKHVFLRFVDKIPDINNSKGGKTYSGSQFDRVLSVVAWLCCSWIMMTHDIMAGWEPVAQQSCSPPGG